MKIQLVFDGDIKSPMIDPRNLQAEAEDRYEVQSDKTIASVLIEIEASYIR